MTNSIAAIVLAAGKGSRMKSTPEQNKVTQLLADKPIISYTVDTLITSGLTKIVVVVGYASGSVRQALGDNVDYAVQESPEGTGHAVKIALPTIPKKFTTILSLYGDDSAFYSPFLINTLIQAHQQNHSTITLVSIIKPIPTGLGRIIRDRNNQIVEIVEEKNATPEERLITEINTGLYCFDRAFLEEALAQITKNSVTGEYYLTDVVGYATSQKLPINSVLWPQNDIWHGVNTPEDLEEAEKFMKAKSRLKLERTI